MPTPFTHLAYAGRLLADEALNPTLRGLLNERLAAFALGSIAADAHTATALPRETTHFYSYDDHVVENLWRVMARRHPELVANGDAARLAFVAGYVGHLTMDEIWLVQMLRPHFVEREWGSRLRRFHLLHVLLIVMDESDRARIHPQLAAALSQAQPRAWLPFLPDEMLLKWRDVIYRQIAPGGRSETLDIISERIGLSPAEVRALIRDASDELWANVPPETLAQVERSMYVAARTQIEAYARLVGL
ncbi:MAG: zinc dependent phospholipase C family protein [Aggregatilineales bacterium]